MLDELARVFPEASRLMGLLYGAAAPVFVTHEDGTVHTMWSEEGSRMGCAAGSAAFCIALAPVLRHTQAKHPSTTLRAATDDVVSFTPLPAVGAAADEWEAWFEAYADFLDTLVTAAGN